MGKTKTRMATAETAVRRFSASNGSASIAVAGDPETHVASAADDVKSKRTPEELVVNPELYTDDHQQSEESDEEQQLQHNGNNASIVLDEKNAEGALQAPWTPRSLGRAKSAIIYKVRRPCIYEHTDRTVTYLLCLANAERHVARAGAQHLFLPGLDAVLCVSSRGSPAALYQSREMGAGTQTR